MQLRTEVYPPSFFFYWSGFPSWVSLRGFPPFSFRLLPASSGGVCPSFPARFFRAVFVVAIIYPINKKHLLCTGRSC